jgi:hypothetical protein
MLGQSPQIGCIHDLRSYLEDILDKTKNEKETYFRNKIKTYLIESNNPSTMGLTQNNIGIRDTSDKSLKIIKSNINGRNYDFYLDTTDIRFWKIYSLHDSKITEKILTKLVLRNNNRLDFVWFPSALLEKYMGWGEDTGFSLKFKNKLNIQSGENKIDVSMRFWGDGGKDLIKSLRTSTPIGRGTTLSSISLSYSVEGGYAKENISYFGGFTLMKGNLIDSHFILVEKIKLDYSTILNSIESNYWMDAYKTNCGIKLKISPLYLEFSKEVEDLETFVNSVFSGQNPFRLLGTIEKVRKDFFRVHAIDLHSNDLINFDITSNLMAIYLNKGSCGNVITRLLTNMQRYMDHRIKLIGDNDAVII